MQKRNMPQQKVNSKDKHCPMLELTILDGDEVMCVVVFSGEREI